jgi:dynein heavy chain
MEFDPSPTEIEEVILDGLHFVAKTMESLPRIETIIYNPAMAELLLKPTEKPTEGGKGSPLGTKRDSQPKESPIRLSAGSGSGQDELKVILDPKEYDQAVLDLKQTVNTCFEQVKASLSRYDDYLTLYSQETSDRISAFFEQEHSFEEYTVVGILKLLSSKPTKGVLNRKLKNIEPFLRKF